MFSLKDRIDSFRHAFAGIAFALKTQPSFRIQAGAAILVSIAAALLGLSAADWRWVVFGIALVLAAEGMNTAFEHLCDVVQPDLHPSVRAAKDVAAGAVLMTSIAAAIIGVLVFWPYVANLVGPPLR